MWFRPGFGEPLLFELATFAQACLGPAPPESLIEQKRIYEKH